MRFPPVPANLPPELQRWCLEVMKAVAEAINNVPAPSVSTPTVGPRVLAAPYQFDQDVTIIDPTKGIVLYDTGTATYQRITLVSGAVNTINTGSAVPPS